MGLKVSGFRVCISGVSGLGPGVPIKVGFRV